MATATVMQNEIKRLVAAEVQRQAGQTVQTLDEQREQSRRALELRMEEMRGKLDEANANERAARDDRDKAEADLAAVRAKYASELQPYLMAARVAEEKRADMVRRTLEAQAELSRGQIELFQLGGSPS
jgi:hypothetical protein